MWAQTHYALRPIRMRLIQLQGLHVATTLDRQAEPIEQVILTKAQKDPFFIFYFNKASK